MPAHLIALFVASGLAVGQYVPGGTFNASMYTDQPGAVIGDGYGDQLYPYDSPAPWQHGYIQSIPAYGGFNYFRPYNYRHVLSQTQVSGGWGMVPQMGYSQQFWHRYADQAALKQPLGHQPRQYPATGSMDLPPQPPYGGEPGGRYGASPYGGLQSGVPQYGTPAYGSP